MKLMMLQLRNFKGTKDFIVEANGEDITVFGNNGTGKTTLVDALAYLLTGQDSNGNKLNPKTLQKNGEAVHNTDHDIEGLFETTNGPLTLRKVFKEKWTRKRGAPKQEFTGHIVDHYIDGIPVRQGKYENRLAKIADDQAIKSLINPDFFPGQLPWQDRREVLVNLAGGVTDADIINANPELAELPKILSGHTVDDHKKLLAVSRKKINEDLKSIPVRISEVQRSLADETGIDEEAERLIMTKLTTEIKAKEKELAQMEMGGGVGAKKEEIANINASLSDELRELKMAHGDIVQEKKKIVDDRSRNTSEIVTSINHAKKRHSAYLENLKQCSEDIKKLKEEFYIVRDEPATIEGVCVTCGQPLPADKIQEARNKANHQKAEHLEDIQRLGKSAADLKALNIKESEFLEGEIVRLENELIAENQELAQANEELSAVELNIPTIEESNEDLKCKAKLEKEIASIEDDGLMIDTQPLILEIDRIRLKRDESQGKINTLRRNKESHKRISDLEAQEKGLLAEFEACEQALFLIEQFIRAKVAVLEETVNNRFQVARWKLFSEQINGGLSECCECVVDGVPYGSGLNTGSRINVGIDIINVMSKHYGINLPVCIDNAESIMEIMPCESQVIKLVVSEDDKTLRVVNNKQRRWYRETDSN